MPVKRRTILKGGAAGAALSALGCKPETPSDSGSGEARIDHVVVVMMENRSFDHYLGTLKLLEGRAVEGLSGEESNPDPEGVEQPVFQLEASCQADPPHGWDPSHLQFNEGANDGFVREHQRRVGTEQGSWVMGYHTREDLPVHYALADHFCLPDHFFCSVMGPTWPNRFYGHTGSSKGMKGNSLPEDGHYDQKSVYQALREVGADWHYFYTDAPFLGLLHEHWDDARIDLIEEFFHRAEAGTLSDFTWVDPGFTFNDDHPPHHPGLGQLFLGLVYEALARSPLWERTLLVITYDEHGGFFDHVPPPKTEDDRAEEGFDQLGFRVPALVIGPWVKQGVESTVFDNTSLLKYLCERFGMEPWTARIAAAESLGACLDEERMARGEPIDPPVMPAFSVPEEEVGPECSYRSGGGGQPELEDFVRATRPESFRTDLTELQAFLMERAERWGLLSG